MDWFNKLHPIVRWILVLPAMAVSYYITFIVCSWSVGRFFGPRDASFLNEIIYIFQGDFLSLLVGFYIGCTMAPKGRIVLSSVFAALSLILAGINVTLFFTGQATATLTVILATIATPAAAGIILYFFIKEYISEIEKQRQLEEKLKLEREPKYEYRGLIR